MSPERDDAETREWLRMQALVMSMRPTLPSPGSEEFWAGVRWWAERIAAIAVDALIRANLAVVEPGKVDEAMEIVAEEIHVRLGIGDYPPTREPNVPPPT
jgi:hypothetical protein